LGYNWAKVDINQTFFDGPTATSTSSDISNTNGGFHYGVGIESTFMPGWSVRAEYTHTGFGNNSDDDDNGFGSEVSVSDNQFMLGLIYHITI
jgi:opacity protein-like surface antigen